MVYRNKYVVWALFVAAGLHVAPATADVSVKIDLADQYPPLAHVSQLYDWQFLDGTFVSSNNSSLTYTATGLPDWAQFDAGTGHITGNVTKDESGDQYNHVSVTASEGGKKGGKTTSSFDLVTIAAPAPTLKTPMPDQLPKAASMGYGNMLPNKVLHLPLGWSFSIGFDGDTFVLPDEDLVHYSTMLNNADPLPDWLVFNEDEMTYSGIAPVRAGPNGTYFDVVLMGSNRPNTGGPSSNFTIYVAGGIITYNDTALPPTLNVTEATPFSYGVSALNQSAFLLDGKRPRSGEFQFQAAPNTPPWVTFDATSQNISGTPPFEPKNTNFTQTVIPLQISHDGANAMEWNVTLDVYPTAFNRATLPNATITQGKEFEVRLDQYLRDSKAPLQLDFGSQLSRRSGHFMHAGLSHRNMRRAAAPSWLTYDASTKSLTGIAPDTDQQVDVHVTAPNPVANAPVPSSQSTFTLFVRNESHPETAPKHALSAGKKGAIAGAILGAALLALLLGLCLWCCRKRRRRTKPVADADPTPAAHTEPTTAAEGTPPSTEADLPYDDPPAIPDRPRQAYSAFTAPVTGAAGAAMAGAAGAAAVGTTTSPAEKRTSKLSVANPTEPVAETANTVLPPPSPQWERTEEDVSPTPFLSQSNWVPTQWPQTTTAKAAGTREADIPEAGAASALVALASSAQGQPTSGEPAAQAGDLHTSINMQSPPLEQKESVPAYLTQVSPAKSTTTTDEASDKPVPKTKPSRMYAMSTLFGGLAAATGIAGAASKDVPTSGSTEPTSAESDMGPEVPQKSAMLSKLFGGAKPEDEEAAIGSPPVSAAPPSSEAMGIQPETASWEDNLWFGERDESAAMRSTIPASGEAPHHRVTSETVPIVLPERSASRTSQSIRPVSALGQNETLSSDATSPLPLGRWPSTMSTQSIRPISSSSTTPTGKGRTPSAAPSVFSGNWAKVDEGDESLSYLGPIQRPAEPALDGDATPVPAQTHSIQPTVTAESEEDEVTIDNVPNAVAEEAEATPAPAPVAPVEDAPRAVPTPTVSSPAVPSPDAPPAVELPATRTRAPLVPAEDTTSEKHPAPAKPTSTKVTALPPGTAPAFAPSSAFTPDTEALEEFAPWHQYDLPASPNTQYHALGAVAPQLAPIPTNRALSPLPTDGTPQLSPFSTDGLLSPMVSGSHFGTAEGSSLGHGGARSVKAPSPAATPEQAAVGLFDNVDYDAAQDPFAMGEYPPAPESAKPTQSAPAVKVPAPAKPAPSALAVVKAPAPAKPTQSAPAVVKTPAPAESAQAPPPLAPLDTDEVEKPVLTPVVRAPSTAGRTPRAVSAIVDPTRSSTMSSIQMAQSRSVSFSAAKPPRLQLASCRPNEAVSLPLVNSQASFPQHLLEHATSSITNPPRYVPHLFAPSRPDLHEKWPEWLSWLSWDEAKQGLTGSVPPAFAEAHRLPMQLPIHILLANGHQVLQETGHERPDPQSAAAPLLVARILLTVLPATQPPTREA